MKRRNKKGMSLSFETIVVAAIALMVLFVVIMVFTGAFGNLWEQITGISSCESKKGTCYAERQEGLNCWSFGCDVKKGEGKWCCTNE